MKLQKTYFTMASLLLLVALASITAIAQVDSVVGKYVGTAKVAGSPDAQISLELANTNGKLTGHLMNGQTKIEVTDGTLAEGKLSLKLGAAAKDGTLTAKVDTATLTGEWLLGTQKKTVELKRVAESAAAAAPINLNGQWEGVADADGQPFPFLLTLKIEGEKVSGGSSSQLGESSISAGSWKDGRLSLQLEGQNGVISMSAVVIEGKLSGEFDYAGQLQGKWVAVKKN